MPAITKPKPETVQTQTEAAISQFAKCTETLSFMEGELHALMAKAERLRQHLVVAEMLATFPGVWFVTNMQDEIVSKHGDLLEFVGSRKCWVEWTRPLSNHLTAHWAIRVF